MKNLIKTLMLLTLLAGGAYIAWEIYSRLGVDETAGRERKAKSSRPIPVEVAPIERGPIELRREFSGTLEAGAEFVVAPKVSGRLERIHVDLGDWVERDAPVAVLDSAEYEQAVRQYQAELAVAEANLAEARSGLEIARRELNRIERLQGRGVSSESQYDQAMADELAKQAALEVARAEREKARAELETARIRLSYTDIRAGWSGGARRRIVASRYVDEGENLTAHTPMLSIVEIDPLVGVVQVTERDYRGLAVGQSVTLRTDAWPDRAFAGEVARIAPIFDEGSRQARVELAVPNDEDKLKPGMFIRVSAVLARKEETLIIPQQALSRREERDGVFVVDQANAIAHWREVALGIQDGDRLEIAGEGLNGPVVILGQQLLEDGSAVILPSETEAATADGTKP